MTNATPSSLHSDLTDGLARGRLCIGEIASISPEELDAIFELGAQRLDTNRNHDAVDVFAGLIALYPYAAKHWRAYGIALHRVMRFPAATAAYQAALLLEPAHLETQCYYGEVLLYLNKFDEAEPILNSVVEGQEPGLKQRATMLLRFLNQARATNEPLSLPISPNQETKAQQEPASMQSAEAAPALTVSLSSPELQDEEAPQEIEDALPSPSTRPYFEMEDGRALPLSPSAFEVEPHQASQNNQLDEFEPATTSLSYRPATDGPAQPPKEPTQTAIIPRRQLRLNEPNRTEDTAIIPGRPAHRAHQETSPNQQPPQEEVTQTAIVKRRNHLPLADENTQIMPGRFFENESSEET